MRTIFLLALIAFVGWKLYQPQESVPVIELIGDSRIQPTYSSSTPDYSSSTSGYSSSTSGYSSSTPGFSCDGREYCGQMASRAEAEFFTRNCPNTKMDGDGDGVPCEHDSRF